MCVGAVGVGVCVRVGPGVGVGGGVGGRVHEIVRQAGSSQDSALPFGGERIICVGMGAGV